MKVRHITTAVVFASVAALAGPATAITSSGSLLQDVNSAVRGDGNITAMVRGNTVTLIGNANGVDKAAAERVAKSFPNIDSVVNLVNVRS